MQLNEVLKQMTDLKKIKQTNKKKHLGVGGYGGRECVCSFIRSLCL